MTHKEYCNMTDNTIGWEAKKVFTATFLSDAQKIKIVEMMNRLLGKKYQVEDIYGWPEPITSKWR